MEEFVVVDVVATEPEAHVLSGLLRDAGIESTYRVTNVGAGAADGLSIGGPQEILVRADDLEAAREVLGQRG